MKSRKIKALVIGFVCCYLSCEAELVINVLPSKTVAQKAVVPLALSNGLSQSIESARAVVFLTDQDGKVVCQGTRWIIGGSDAAKSLKAGATNLFNFVIAADKPLATNLTAKVTVNRIVLEGGKVGDPTKDVTIRPK